MGLVAEARLRVVRSYKTVPNVVGCEMGPCMCLGKRAFRFLQANLSFIGSVSKFEL